MIISLIKLTTALPDLVKEIREAAEAISKAKEKLFSTAQSPEVTEAIKELDDVYKKLKEIIGI